MSGERYSLGTCRYCGQVVNLERERDSQEAADIAASEECSCYDAREERAIQRKIENAQDRIQKVFGSEAEELGFRPINAPEPIQLMNDIAVLIARGYITSAVVNVRGQCRAKISLTSKEKIKVERSETRSYQLEEWEAAGNGKARRPPYRPPGNAGRARKGQAPPAHGHGGIYPPGGPVLCPRVRGRHTRRADTGEFSTYRGGNRGMKNEKSRPAEYRPTASGPMKLYLVRHKDGQEITVNGRNRYEAVTAAARKWGVRWTSIARACEFIELASEDEEETAP